MAALLAPPYPLKRAQDSRDISECAYKRGAASLLDFLDAERSFPAMPLAYRQALADYLLAVEQVKRTHSFCFAAG